MTSYELNEIKSLLEKYCPLSSWAYFGYGLLFSLPLIGFILLIVFSLDSSNINRRNYARSYFCVIVILLILALIALTIYFFTGLGLPFLH